MPSTILPRFGGSFAPPLDGTKLAAYRSLAASAEPQISDPMLKLCTMAEVFHETPASPLNGSPHPSGHGTIIPLEDGEIKRIWDHVPWDHECDMYAKLFEQVEAATAASNSDRVIAWQTAVRYHIVQKAFPEPGLYEKLLAALRTVAQWIGLLSSAEQSRIAAEQTKVQACITEIGQAMSTKSYATIPYPTLEPTPLRDACFHLLWYAKELERDREPLTKDRL